MNANETIGMRIKRLRTERGWSLSRLEQYSGVSRMHINNIERGQRRPSVQSIALLAKGLRVDVDYLTEVCDFKLWEHDPVTRYWEKIDKRGEDECWPWIGRVGHHGYPQLDVDNKSLRAARFGYKFLVGPIPEEMTIHHTCNMSGCMNPRHWQLVTATENTQLRWRANLEELRLEQQLLEQLSGGEIPN